MQPATYACASYLSGIRFDAPRQAQAGTVDERRTPTDASITFLRVDADAMQMGGYVGVDGIFGPSAPLDGDVARIPCHAFRDSFKRDKFKELRTVFHNRFEFDNSGFVASCHSTRFLMIGHLFASMRFRIQSEPSFSLCNAPATRNPCSKKSNSSKHIPSSEIPYTNNECVGFQL